FFFQAEDGIRARNVTGVQTCALPIFSASGTRVTTRSTAAEKMLDSATPVKIRVIREAPARWETASTSMALPKAPPKAAMGVSPTAMGARAQHRATAAPAPALTPITLGEARGLASTVWITAPATARQAPAARQPAVRGSRTYRTMAAPVPSPRPARAASSSPGGTVTAPTQRLTTPASSASAAVTASTPRLDAIQDLHQMVVGLAPPGVGLEMVQVLVHIVDPALPDGGQLLPGRVGEHFPLQLRFGGLGVRPLQHDQDLVRIRRQDGLHAQILQKALVLVRDVDAAQVRQHLPQHGAAAALGLDHRGRRPDIEDFFRPLLLQGGGRPGPGRLDLLRDGFTVGLVGR